MVKQDEALPEDRPSDQASTVILGVAESDAHVVANHILNYILCSAGYRVINLGACTPAADFIAAFRQYPNARAVIVGSTNGHAATDLRDLAQAKRDLSIECPVIVGGNLGVTPEQAARTSADLLTLGVDTVLQDVKDLLPALQSLPKRNTVGWSTLDAAP